MSTTNEIRIVGTLVDGPVAETSKDGRPRCRLTIVTREKTFGGVNYDNRLKVHLYGQQAEQALSKLTADSLLLVKGRAKPYRFQRQQGQWESGFYIQAQSAENLGRFDQGQRIAEDISYNEVLLMGYLARDALDKERGGLPVVELTLMTDEVRKDSDGKRQQRPESHKIIVFSEPIIRHARTMLKGDLVLLAGRYQNHSFKGASGDWINLYEVVTTKPQLVSRKQVEEEL